MVSYIKVCNCRLKNLSEEDRSVLVSYADLTNNSALDYTMVLYSSTVLEILGEYQQDGKDSGISEELAAFLEDIYDKDIDQYIFK